MRNLRETINANDISPKIQLAHFTPISYFIIKYKCARTHDDVRPGARIRFLKSEFTYTGILIFSHLSVY